MKLISKYKDYYDFYSKVYGRDDRIVYNRGVKSFSAEQQPDPETAYRIASYSVGYKEHIMIIGVCGRFYLFNSTNPTNNTDYKLVYQDTPKKRVLWGYSQIKTGDVCKPLLNYQKAIGEPVIALDGFSLGGYVRNLFLNKRVPILKDFGIDKLLPPEQCYQEIYQFLTELNNKEVLTKMEDRDKIVSHGFDSKQSFRHRN